MTNAVKHGAEPIAVCVRYEPAHVAVRIDNALAACPPTADGYGIIGLRERAELIGATLETVAEPDRFSLCLLIPT